MSGVRVRGLRKSFAARQVLVFVLLAVAILALITGGAGGDREVPYGAE